MWKSDPDMFYVTPENVTKMNAHKLICFSSIEKESYKIPKWSKMEYAPRSWKAMSTVSRYIKTQ